MSQRDEIAGLFRATQQGTNAGATATDAADGQKTHFCDHISGVSDAASTLQILDGANVIWELKLQANVPYSEVLESPLKGTPGNAMSVKVTSSTAYCSANIAGFKV